MPLTANHTQSGSIQLLFVLVPEVEDTLKMSKERVELAKALIKASEKPAKPAKGRAAATSKGGESNGGDTKGSDASHDKAGDVSA